MHSYQQSTKVSFFTRWTDRSSVLEVKDVAYHHPVLYFVVRKGG